MQHHQLLAERSTWISCWTNGATGHIANEHDTQPAGFLHETVDFVIAADHGHGSFHAGVKVIHPKEDCSIVATPACELGEIECKKDTGDLLALAFTPELNAALKRIVIHERNADGKLVSDGKLSIHRKAMQGSAASKPSFHHAVLDRTGPLLIDNTLAHAANIRVFITGHLAFHAAVVGKEGMDKAHCLWCKLESAEWKECMHARGTRWDLEEMKKARASLSDANTSHDGVKTSMLPPGLHRAGKMCLPSSACDTWACKPASE
jgi:hypothetical protein